MGDSKTANFNWPLYLTRNLNISTAGRSENWQELTPRFGVAGYTTAQMKTKIDSDLASVTGTADKVSINLGANDVSALPAQATWKANMTSIVDSLRAKWPNCKIYIDRPWRQSYTTECNSLATWISDIVATYPSGVYVGTDERVWLENGDNGATYTTDGTHYTLPAGDLLCAQKKAQAMGY